MKKIQNRLFGETSCPSSLDELIGLIQSPIKFSEHFNVRMWRGHGDLKWPIHSSAYRRLALSKKVPTESDMQSYEKSLLAHATHKGLRFIDGRRLSDMDLLARLQHHGAATRLIDATRNSLIALWFCCLSEKEKTGALLGFSHACLGGYEGEPKEKDYDDTFSSLEKWNNPQTWEPPAITNRIAAQHSQFLYSSVVKKKHGSLALEHPGEDILVIGITPQLKTKLRKQLSELFDIRQITMFPDLDGFSQANSFKFEEYENYRW